LAEPAAAPALFFDFDNTITRGDVLDRVIERFSMSDAWREWEAKWQQGRISTVECLTRQVRDLRVESGTLLEFVAGFEIDAHFAPIVEWAEKHGTELVIVSDNFDILIHAILDRQGLGTIPVVANALTISGDRLEPRFPWRDNACPRCAHCKARHVRDCVARPRIFVGDGLSDVCPSLIAEEVFAKGSLATALSGRFVNYRSYRHLGEVLEWLDASERQLSSV
jgi:2-hydroxy-3-keto-5-methylthiopentenyl-1-phosphate phosphatase